MSLTSNASAAINAADQATSKQSLADALAAVNALLAVMTDPVLGVCDNTVLVSGGTGYAIGDTITLSNGVVIGVTNVAGGVISQMVVANRGSTTVVPANPVAQISTTGVGIGASFNFTWGSIAPATLVPGSLASNAGTLTIGGEQPAPNFAGTESTLIGVRAGGGFASGGFNTAVGHNAGGQGVALGAGLNANNCTYIGCDAGRNIQGGGAGNTAIGAQAGRNNNAGNWNTFVGWGAGKGVDTGVTTAVSNTGVGNGALGGAGNLTTGGSNCAMGDGAGLGLTTGGGNVMIGYHCAYVLTTGANNVCVGNSAGVAMTTGAGNTFVGNGAGFAVTGATDSTLIGNIAGVGWTGGQTVAIGSKAGGGSGSAANNVVVGYQAGAVLTGGSNLILGNRVAVATLTTGTGNIYLGVSSAIDAATAGESNFFRLGNNATNLMRATGINTATPAFFFDWIPASTSYASDSAAATGGVAVGQVYRNGSVLQCRIS